MKKQGSIPAFSLSIKSALFCRTSSDCFYCQQSLVDDKQLTALIGHLSFPREHIPAVCLSLCLLRAYISFKSIPLRCLLPND